MTTITRLHAASLKSGGREGDGSVPVNVPQCFYSGAGKNGGGEGGTAGTTGVITRSRKAPSSAQQLGVFSLIPDQERGQDRRNGRHHPAVYICPQVHFRGDAVATELTGCFTANHEGQEGKRGHTHHSLSL